MVFTALKRLLSILALVLVVAFAGAVSKRISSAAYGSETDVKVKGFFALLQIVNPDTEVRQLSIQRNIQTEKFCKAILDATWSSASKGCIGCKLEISSCVSNLPSDMQQYMSGSQASYDYVYGTNESIVLLNKPTDQTKNTCESQAQSYRDALGESFRCVLAKR